jgi:hypothetical protein
METFESSLLNAELLDTTSPRGKILFINSRTSQPDHLFLDKNVPPRKDILAFGLRNPWNHTVYKNYLFVPDVGWDFQEELNVVNLDEFNDTKKPYLFGWPYFEATVNNNIERNRIFLHSDNSSSQINTYVLQNSIEPSLFYSHQGNENFRAAIIDLTLFNFLRTLRKNFPALFFCCIK